MARRLEVTTADRLRLLGAVELLAPQVLDELRAVQAGDELALAQWGLRWNLSAEWVLDTARRTVDWWARGRGGRSWRLSRPAWRRATDRLPMPMGTNENRYGAHAAGYPGLDASPVARHRARRELAGEADLLETVERDHIEAFVRYQVLGVGVVRLRDLWPGRRRPNTGVDSYDRAMDAELKSLRLAFGLPRRPKAKPGRRRAQ